MLKEQTKLEELIFELYNSGESTEELLTSLYTSYVTLVMSESDTDPELKILALSLLRKAVTIIK